MPAGAAGGDEGGGDDSPLLAVPPGSRNAPRLTPGAKGKVYHPKKVDRRDAGARTRSIASKYAKEKSSNTLRNIVPGLTDIITLKNGSGIGIGINEYDHSTYKQRELDEEDRVFQINESVRSLLRDLETTTNNLTENENEDKTQQKA